MTLICGCRVSLALKYMPKMTVAVGTDDFRSLHTESTIDMSSHCTGDGIKVRRPAATGFELVIGLVKRCITASAIVNAFGRIVGVVVTTTGPLGSFFAEDTELLYYPAL